MFTLYHTEVMQVFPSLPPKGSTVKLQSVKMLGTNPRAKHKGLKNYFQLNWILAIHFSLNLFEIEIMKTQVCGQQIVLQSWLSRTITLSLWLFVSERGQMHLLQKW